MGPAGRWLAAAALVVAMAAGVVHIALPANETVADGAADPILSIRRPAVKALIWVGVLRGPGIFVDRYPYLPTVGGYEWSTRGPGGEYVPVGKVEVRKEPVYRGLFWLVGHRITYRRTSFGVPDGYTVRRLCYVEGDREVVAGENPSPDPGAPCSEVSGFVPSSARGFWVETMAAHGDVQVDAWGDCGPSLRD